MNKHTPWLLAFCIVLGACSESDFKKPNYPPNPKPTLETTISSDGKLIAALDKMGTEAPRLRIKWIDKDEPWQDLQAPPFTSDIRFGLTGYGLLLTHYIPGKAGETQLTRWDVSDLTQQPEMLYIGTNLAFPIEPTPGQVLVRTCTPYKLGAADGCTTNWFLVLPNGTTQQITSKKSSISYNQPNITPGGFFWFDRHSSQQKRDHQSVLAYALPGGREPEVDVSMLDKFTMNLICDYQTQRCLHGFLAGKNPVTGHFIYDIEIFEGSRRCRPTGLTGWSDGQSVTPDGRVAVMSLAQAYDSPRHVVVMHFKPGQCEPILIDHLEF